MNCCETKRHLEPFLDGELNVEANLEVLRHLGLCPACSSIFEGEKQLLEMVRSNCPAACPAPLRARIVASLDHASPPVRRGHPIFRAAVPMAAAALIVSLVTWAIVKDPDPTRVDPMMVATAAVVHHMKPSDGTWHPTCPDEVAREKLEQYFASKHQSTCLHDLSALGYKFVQGSVSECGLAGQVTCWTEQEGKVRITHASLPAPDRFDASSMTPIGEYRMTKCRVQNRTVLVFHGNGKICLFVLDCPKEAERVLEALAAK